MSEGLRKQIIDAFGEAAKNGGISGSGDGKIAMTSDGWKALEPLLDAAIAAAHAKGRAEGIGEAVKALEDRADEYRANCEAYLHRSSVAALRAFLTTGGSDAA